MLSKSLQSKYFRTNGRLHRPSGRLQNIEQGLRRTRNQVLQRGLRHPLQHQRNRTDQQRNDDQRGHKARRHGAVQVLGHAMESKQAPARLAAKIKMLTKSR